MNSISSALAMTQTAIDYDPFAGGALTRVVPTTESQREVWLADKLGRDASLAFNESVSLRLRGQLDPQALHDALRTLLERHDALRASFGPDGETFCVREHGEIALPLIDLSALPATERDAAVQAHLQGAVQTPFVLEHDPLFRAALLRLSGDEHLLMLTAHHIVCDGWSWWLIVHELGQSYAQNREGDATPALPDGEAFADYALDLALHPGGASLAADEAYWLSRFADGAPMLDLPTDRPRPAQRSFVSERVDHVFDAALVSAIRRMGGRRGASLFATLLAGFAGLMSRLTGQAETVVGIPAAGQSVDGHDHLVGHCVNLLPLRCAIDAAQPFAQALDEMQATLLDALEHQRYTFGTMLKKLRIPRDPSRMPLVNVMFNIDQALDLESAGFPGLALEFSSNPRRFENFELFINAVQAHGELRLECQFNRDLFDAATVNRWLAAYETLLRSAIEQPDTAFARLPWVDAAAQAELAALQPAPVAFDRECRMHEHFELQCDRTPDRTALRCAALESSYAELEARANRIARLLRARGIHRGALVGLALDRDADMLAALLGVLKSGAGYVPLDPQFPAERLGYMAGDAGLAALVTQSRHAAHFDLRGRPVLLLDELGGELEAASSERIGRDADAALPESPAYVIYTSGSTGRPKGVQVPHRAIANFLQSMRREPGLLADDRLVAVTTLSFDIAVLELLLPLTVGAQVVLADRGTAGDGNALAALLADMQATAMQATPSTWRLLLDAGWTGDARFKALCGGEALAPDLAARLLPCCASLWNLYGPTETTVWSTCARIDPPPPQHLPDIHIGWPIGNTRVWIVDDNGELCPLGVPGEICIGGEGVALGYLQRPELTAERFIPDRFSERPSGQPAQSPEPMLYRTGDRGRWRADGNLEHLGRLDFQVKVRGYRIELGEIENALSSHPSVARAVVIAREDRPGDVRLVAYVVAKPGMAAEEAALLAHLRNTLPDYMIVQHLVALDAIPLLPNGKIDRKALPVPVSDGKRQSRGGEPRNDLERAIAVAMAQSLGLPEIGVDDDFFALGGHSLLAAQLSARLNRELAVPLSLRTLFDAPTVSRLAQAVAGLRSATAPPRKPVGARADRQRAPLSLMQQRLWYLEQLSPDRVVYNTPSAHRLTGELDEQAFEQAFREIVRRQATLRTIIEADDETPMQRVLDSVPVSLFPAEDLSALDEQERERVLAGRLEQLTNQPFNLTQGPLFRVRLFRLSERQHVMFFMPHHIIWDGWSFDLFYKEMGLLYGAFHERRPSPLPELAVDYGDFAAWHLDWVQGEELSAQVEHWKQRLAGQLEPLDLPLDHSRPARASATGSTEWVRVEKDLTDAVGEAGRHADATLFMTLLAAYGVLLHRMSGQREIVIGLPFRNRDSGELEAVMGFFVNMLPLRLNIDPSLPFIELVKTVREAVMDAFAYPDVPFERLVHELKVPRDYSRSPIYQAVFSFQDVRQRLSRWGNLQHETMMLFQRGASDDIGLWFLAHDQGLSGGLIYNSEIFEADTASRLRQRYLAILQSAAADPHVPVAALEVMAANERAEISALQPSPSPFDRQCLMHEHFERQCEQTPNEIAVRAGNHSMTYCQLEARANRIAHWLRIRGIGRGALVGLALDRGIDMLATLLGILKAGAGYVPLDPAFPQERLAFMVGDAGLAALVTQSAHASRFETPGLPVLALDVLSAQVQSLSEARIGRDGQSAEPESAAYVIYTSGSTGKPKGVQVPHRAVANFIAAMQQRPGIDAGDRLVAVTTLSFDIAVLELMLPLSVGAEVVLADRETASDGHALMQLLGDSDATLMQATPATWHLLIEAGWKGGGGFKVLCGGEPLAPDLALALQMRSGQVWNLYGPTETCVWSSAWLVRNPELAISIGTPIANTTIWILDQQQRLCPIGVPGEICIGGEGVATGYLNRPELTGQRFIADPFSDRPGARLYRTGDRGRWRANGTLEHLGRFDFQVKVRGYRIEPGEIEAALVAHPEVMQAVVITREDLPGDVRIVAYVVMQAGVRCDAADLREHLRATLPEYMLPQHIVPITAVPLLPNGKTDRDMLPMPDNRALGSEHSHDSLSSDPREQLMVSLWRELIGVEHVGPHDNFFELGGTSMLALRLVTRIQKKTGVRMNLLKLASGTVRSLAQELPQEKGGKLPPRGIADRLRRLLGRPG